MLEWILRKNWKSKSIIKKLGIIDISRKNLLDRFAVKRMTLEIDHLFKTKMAQDVKFKGKLFIIGFYEST